MTEEILKLSGNMKEIQLGKTMSEPVAWMVHDGEIWNTSVSPYKDGRGTALYPESAITAEREARVKAEADADGQYQYAGRLLDQLNKSEAALGEISSDYRGMLADRNEWKEKCRQAEAALARLREDYALVEKELLGGLLTDLHNITYSIDHCGDYYARKNGPMYSYTKEAQEKIRKALAADKGADHE